MTESNAIAVQAETLIKKYLAGAVGVGLVPLPLVDMAALAGLQLKLLHSLARLYGVEFSGQLGKSAVAALLGGGIPVSLATQLGSLAKGLPIYGWAVGAFGTALFGGASTYAIGKVFVQHFESGNTFLNFDPQQVKAYYAQQFEQGREEVRKSFAGIKP